jgi:hypothetical protein
MAQILSHGMVKWSWIPSSTQNDYDAVVVDIELPQLHSSPRLETSRPGQKDHGQQPLALIEDFLTS